MDYEIILPLKVRTLTIAKAYKYIEAIQSYPGDWSLVVVTGNVEKLKKARFLEGITPLPTTYGALCFPELYLNDELLVAMLKEKLDEEEVVGIIKAINRGERIHRLIPRSLLREVEQRMTDLIAGADFEVFIPLEEITKELDEIVKRINLIEYFELFKTSAFPVEPELVEEILDRAYHVGEYLSGLEKIFDEAKEEELDILRVEGFIKSDMKLKELEETLQSLVDQVPAKRVTLMFTRVIL